jgi:hypothetical protein
MADQLPPLLQIYANLFLPLIPKNDGAGYNFKRYGRQFLTAQFTVYMEAIGADPKTAAALLRVMRDAVQQVSPGLALAYRMEPKRKDTDAEGDPYSARALEKSVKRFFGRFPDERTIMEEHVRVFFADPQYRRGTKTFSMVLDQLPPRGH